MNSKVFLSMLIIIGAVFSLITYYKLKEYPTGDCCKNIRDVNSEVCIKCDSYQWYEKVIYVWRFS